MKKYMHDDIHETTKNVNGITMKLDNRASYCSYANMTNSHIRDRNINPEV